MPDLTPRRLLAAFIAAILAAGGIGIALTSDDDGQGHKRHAVTVTLGGPGHKEITLTPPAQAIVKAQAKQDAAGDDVGAEADLHETTAPPPAARAKADAIAPKGQPPIPVHVPLATVHEPGCSTALVRNYGTRGGEKILFGFLHWTASSPTPGSPASGLAIVRWFDTPGAQASSHYVTDQDGRCWLTVAESQSAWTEANANRWGLSVEVVNRGVMPLFQTRPARRAVVRLMVKWHHRWGIPYRHGIIRQGPRRGSLPSCIPVRSGFLAHRDAGACGGGHPDVGSFDVDGLIREARIADQPKKLTKRQKWERRHGEVHKALATRCATRTQGATTTCRDLRSRNRTYHRLLARK